MGRYNRSYIADAIRSLQYRGCHTADYTAWIMITRGRPQVVTAILITIITVAMLVGGYYIVLWCLRERRRDRAYAAIATQVSRLHREAEQDAAEHEVAAMQEDTILIATVTDEGPCETPGRAGLVEPPEPAGSTRDHQPATTMVRLPLTARPEPGFRAVDSAPPPRQRSASTARQHRTPLSA